MRYNGTIVKLADSSVSVSVDVDKDACSACHVKSSCEVGTKESKIVVVETTDSLLFNLGQRITIEGKQKSELKAVLLAYVIPFFILFVTLMISHFVLSNDGLSGLVTLLVLMFYYFVLYMLKNRLKGSFAFSIINDIE